MIFKRKIYKHLLDWKANSNGETAALIEGARRVGKSSIAIEFGKHEYRSYILVDFNTANTGIRNAIRDNPDDLDGLFNLLMLEYHQELFRRESLIIFDEIQRFPPARQLIKYLVADGRYDYIETGSLISIKKNVESITIPSEEFSIGMFPMDFEEFSWAMDDNVSYNFIRDAYMKQKPLGREMHETLMRRYREYLLVGGMPQAVSEYAQSKNLAKVDAVKRNILRLYHEDIAKFAGSAADKVRGIFDQIPGQLSKKEKRYHLSAVDTDARMRDYRESFDWLNEAMVVNIARNATDPDVALAMSEDNSSQKLYSSDTGLLITQAFSDSKFTENDLYKSVLLGDVSINEGMIAENAVAQAFRMNGRRLFFYSRYQQQNPEGRMEIDFLVRKGSKICPVEVKSGAYQRHASLDKFRAKFKKRLGDSYIIYAKDLMVKDGIIHLPFYMASLI